jgi:hypothetical protein
MDHLTTLNFDPSEGNSFEDERKDEKEVMVNRCLLEFVSHPVAITGMGHRLEIKVGMGIVKI